MSTNPTLITQKKLPYQSYSVDKTLLETNSNLEGLRIDEITNRLDGYGYNQLTKKQSTPAIFSIFGTVQQPFGLHSFGSLTRLTWAWQNY